MGNTRGRTSRALEVISNPTYVETLRKDLLRSIEVNERALNNLTWHDSLGLLTGHAKPAATVKSELRAMDAEGLIVLVETENRVTISMADPAPFPPDAA